MENLLVEILFPGLRKALKDAAKVSTDPDY
jgi:hypothetical protein